MKKLPGTSILFSILCLFLSANLLSQDSIPLVDSVYQNFQNQEQPVGRFSYFFNTPNRYNQNSAYDWLDSVNQYLNDAMKVKDSVAIRHYMIIQSQVYYDLGDYDRSLAISKELYELKDSFNLDYKTKLLGLMDST